MSNVEKLTGGVMIPDEKGKIRIKNDVKITIDKNVILPEKEEKEIDSKESDGMIV